MHAGHRIQFVCRRADRRRSIAEVRAEGDHGAMRRSQAFHPR
jgi:hypothetical protein